MVPLEILPCGSQKPSGELTGRGGLTGSSGKQYEKLHLPSCSSYYILFLQPVLPSFVQPSVIHSIVVSLCQKFDVTVLPGKDKSEREVKELLKSCPRISVLRLTQMARSKYVQDVRAG